MQSHDSSRPRSPRPQPNFPAPSGLAPEETTPALPGLAPELPFAESRVVIAAPALLVEARFRDVPLASRLLRADETRAFTIGAARGADAPANPAYLGASAALADTGGHALVEPMSMGGGFALNLAPAMRAELLTPVQVLPLRPDFGRAEAPLMLPPDSCLRVSCGEVEIVLWSAEPAAVVRAPRFGADWRSHIWYDAGVGLALLVLLLIVRAIPEDPRSLSLEDVGRNGRLDSLVTIPPIMPLPEADKAIDKDKTPGGGGDKAAAGKSGKAGDKRAKPTDGRRAIQGNTPKDSRDVAGEIRKNSILAYLDGTRSGALGKVLDDKPVMGDDAETVLGALQGTTIAANWGTGLGPIGTGEYGGGTGDRTLGAGTIGTLGKFGAGDGPGTGPGRGYGEGVGKLRTRTAKVPDPILGVASVRGQLDKEIIRRIVRRHINEVKYCYDQALARSPKLDGRLVTQFTISGSGQVLASVVQSSTLGSPAVEMCVVNAIKRWQFPAPEKGGLVIVSYPFTFSPAGN
jgi:TonB family protein